MLDKFMELGAKPAQFGQVGLVAWTAFLFDKLDGHFSLFY
jgi:hypothetical protein